MNKRMKILKFSTNHFSPLNQARKKLNVARFLLATAENKVERDIALGEFSVARGELWRLAKSLRGEKVIRRFGWREIIKEVRIGGIPVFALFEQERDPKTGWSEVILTTTKNGITFYEATWLYKRMGVGCSDELSKWQKMARNDFSNLEATLNKERFENEALDVMEYKDQLLTSA